MLDGLWGKASFSAVARWYVSPFPANLLRLPLGLLLLYFLAVASVASGLLWWASVRASWAVGGLFGLSLGLFGPPLLYLFPPMAYWLLAAHLPQVWGTDRPWFHKWWMTVLYLVVVPIVATAAYRLGVLLVGWIAGLNPCAALAVGVVGSSHPYDCPAA